MSEMTGLERLRALGREQEERSWSTVGKVRGRLMLQIAEQIEDERFREQLAVERVASEMELHCLGVEGMDDSPVARWARELREALGGDERDHADEREAIAWVRKHGGLDAVKRDAACWNTAENIAQTTLGWLARVCPVAGIEKCGYGVALEKLEDAINRRLMPEGMEWLVDAWPRFEDGEPIRFGDWFENDNDGKSVLRKSVLSTVTIRDLRDGRDCCFFWKLGDGPRAVLLKDGERVRRPAPKVLDADGVEIREKRDVWWICEGDERGVHAERLRVETICPNGLVECSPYNGGTWVYLEPSELYVNKPVPASDGRPLREGETVWDVYGQGPLVVRALPSEGEQLAVLDNGGTNFYRYPEKLTHERPDSWERMEEDCAKSDVDYCAERGLLDPSCDTVEGDASTRHCTDCGCTCGEKMARDLVRRTKALAERGA